MKTGRRLKSPASDKVGDLDMKKIKTCALLMLIAGMLFSCDAKDGSSSVPVGGDSSSTPQTKIYWSEEVDSLLAETITEDGLKLLPAFESGSYKANNAKDSSSSIEYTTIYCLSDNISGNEARLYGVVLTASGFFSQDSGSSYLRYKELDDTRYLIVTFAQGKAGSGYSLALNVYLSNYCYSSWPETLIKQYTGLSNIPHLEGTYYYIQYNDDGSLYINIEGLSSSCIKEYTSLLENSGYEITYYTSSVVVYSATSPDNSHTISYYYDADTSMMALRVAEN